MHALVINLNSTYDTISCSRIRRIPRQALGTMTVVDMREACRSLPVATYIDHI